MFVTLKYMSSRIVGVSAGQSATAKYAISWYASLGDAADIHDENAVVGVTSLPSGVTASCAPTNFSLNDEGSNTGSVTFSAAVNAPPSGPAPVTISITLGSSPVPVAQLTFQLTVQQGFYTGNGSVTLWQFFASQAMDQSSPEELATARIRDPLWMLARQWQLKEFEGDDAGSAIQVRYLAQQVPVNRYVGGSGVASVFNGHSRAMECAVESETVNLTLRGAVQLGLRFEAMLADAQGTLSLSAAALRALVAKFRNAFPITPPPASALYDMRASAYASLAAGSVTNGWMLYQLASTQPTSPAIPAGANQVVESFVKWCAALYVQPEGDAAWNAERITYNFGAAATESSAATIIRAPDFPGGQLDWYDFDFAGNAPVTTGSQEPGSTTISAAKTGTALGMNAARLAQVRTLPPALRPRAALAAQLAQARSATNPSAELIAQLRQFQAPSPTAVAASALPNHVRFTSMPEPRYWNFEDGKLNLGAVQPNTTDIATMLVLEFAFVYSNDWFIVTVPTPIGSLTQVVGVVVTDTFGIRTLIEPADGTTTGPDGNAIWTMFTMSGATGQMDSVLLAPTLAEVQNGPAIEEVWFARDDMAAMAWGEERTLQGPMDSGVDVYEDVLRRTPPTTPLATGSTTADVAYVLGTSVPANWIPMVPIPDDTLFRLRRGAMAPLDPTTLISAPVYPRGVVLRQDQLQAGQPPMLLVRDSAIPPTGVQVKRYFRRARWIDGSSACWIARDVTAGKGQASSGLAFDVLQSVVPASS